MVRSVNGTIRKLYINAYCIKRSISRCRKMRGETLHFEYLPERRDSKCSVLLLFYILIRPHTLTQTHAYVHTCTHTHAYVHTCTHMHTQIQIHTCANTRCAHMHIHIYAHIHTHAQTHTLRTHAHRHTHIRTCTHTRTHAHILISYYV